MRGEGNRRFTLKEAVAFHGHLGPYLVLGILAGEFALKRLRCKKYFNLTVKVWGVNKKPKSCLIDGLQLSTGATYGKGNIIKLNGSEVKVVFCNCFNNQKLKLTLKDSLIQLLAETKTHRHSELLARKLYNADCSDLFSLKPITYDL